MNNSRTVEEQEQLICPKMEALYWDQGKESNIKCMSSRCAWWLWEGEDYRFVLVPYKDLPLHLQGKALFTREKVQEPTGHCGLVNLGGM